MTGQLCPSAKEIRPLTTYNTGLWLTRPLCLPGKTISAFPTDNFVPRMSGRFCPSAKEMKPFTALSIISRITGRFCPSAKQAAAFPVHRTSSTDIRAVVPVSKTGSGISRIQIGTTDIGTSVPASKDGIRIYPGICETEPDTGIRIRPTACCDGFPPGISSGNITVILPLSRITALCDGSHIVPAEPSGKYRLSAGRQTDTDWNSYDMQVCGLFADTDAALYDRLLRQLDSDSPVRLTNVRKNVQLWNDSMHHIHLAMNCICLLLFSLHCSVWPLPCCFTACNAAMVLLFYGLLAARKSTWYRFFPWKRCAVLFTECCTPCPHPACYVFPVWQIRFALPVHQLLLMTALTALTSAAATAASWYLIKRRDFLTEIRNII